MEGEGIEQAETVLGDVPLEEVPVDVEGEMPIIIANEGMDESALIDQYDGE